MRTAVIALALSAGLATPSVFAQVQVNLAPRANARLTLDGLVRDCASVAELVAVDDASHVVSGGSAWSGADDAAFGFATLQDDEGLWIAAEVHDDRIVRSREHRDTDDALVLTLAVTANGRPVAYEIALMPGEPGQYAGAARYGATRTGTVPGAQVVEAPLSSGIGFTLEARVPWGAIPELRGALGSLRGRMAYRDNDTGRVDSVIASGNGDARRPADLPPAVGAVGTSGPANLLQRFQFEHELGATPPVFDRAVNLAGDAAQERVVVFPQYIVAYGPGISGGANYTFSALPTQSAADVLEVDARDLTGDGRSEVTLRLRVPTQAFSREIFMVYGLDASGVPVRLFAHEIARTQQSSRVADRVSFEPGGIRFSGATAQGFTAQSFPSANEAGVEALLTPWGPLRSQLYAWRANAFVLDRSEPNPSQATNTTPFGAPLSATNTTGPVQAGPDVAAVLRLFRQREGIAESVQPDFTMSADVAEDTRPEYVMVFGRTVVVMGTGYVGGRSYYSLQLPLSDGDTVMSLSLVDLTRDGHAEAVVRVRRTSNAQVLGQNLVGHRELLLAYSFEPTRRGRMFAAEIARRVGDFSIVNEVTLPRAPNAPLVIDAGRATGWTADNYPFHDVPQPGIEPLMLPWNNVRTFRFVWNGTALVRQP